VEDIKSPGIEKRGLIYSKGLSSWGTDEEDGGKRGKPEGRKQGIGRRKERGVDHCLERRG